MLNLPLHPSMRDPRTGQPLRALYVDRHGRPRFPIMGGAPEDGDQGGDNGSGSNSGSQGGQNNGGSGSSGDQGDAGNSGQNNDGNGSGPNAAGQSNDDLGFPRDTPWREMAPEQQAAYWQHQSRKHESTWKNIVGDRKVDDIKNDLDELEQIRQEKLTPSEKAIAEAERRGRESATAESNTKAATAILRAQLDAQGHESDDIDELVDSLDMNKFIVDGDIDTDKLATFAKKFTPAGTATPPRRRDFGGGRRRDSHDRQRGAGGKAEAQRRFGQTTTGTGA